MTEPTNVVEPTEEEPPIVPERSDADKPTPSLGRRQFGHSSYRKLNDPDLFVGDRVRYWGEWGHVSAITPKVLGDAPYNVAVRTDTGSCFWVQIDPTKPISSDSDCREMHEPVFTNAELKVGKKKKAH